jgi:hypothetical protein
MVRSRCGGIAPARRAFEIASATGNGPPPDGRDLRKIGLSERWAAQDFPGISET